MLRSYRCLNHLLPVYRPLDALRPRDHNLSCLSVSVVCTHAPLLSVAFMSLYDIFILCFYVLIIHFTHCIFRDCYHYLFGALCSVAFHFPLRLLFVRLSHSLINMLYLVTKAPATAATVVTTNRMLNPDHHTIFQAVKQQPQRLVYLCVSAKLFSS